MIQSHVIHLVIGIGILMFGLLIGGVGLASAGIGIGIPMVPLGAYMTYRGWRIYKHGEDLKDSDVINPEPLVPLENTNIGKVALGILLILIGLGTSTMLIGIPILLLGLWIIYKAIKLHNLS